MTITIGQSHILHTILSNLLNQNSGSTRFKFQALTAIRELDPHSQKAIVVKDPILQKQNEVILQFAPKDENGKPIVGEKGEVKLTNSDEFKAAMEALTPEIEEANKVLGETVEVSSSIYLSVLPDNLSTNDVMQLDLIVDKNN